MMNTAGEDDKTVAGDQVQMMLKRGRNKSEFVATDPLQRWDEGPPGCLAQAAPES